MAKKNLMSNAMRRKVALGKMHALSRHAQRAKLNENHVDSILTRLDLDYIGLPVLSERSDGTYYIIDGHHRIEALKRWIGEGWEVQQIECQVFSGLSEAEEARTFRATNKGLKITAMDNFRTALVAGEPEETRINEIITREGLCVSRDKVAGAIGAVATLIKVYRRSDGETLGTALRIIRDAFGDSGFDALVIDGVAHLCQRYNGALDETVAVAKLSAAHGGVNGLLGRAATVHKQTGNVRAHCLAAAAVDIINQGRGKKLPSWWKDAR